MGIFLRQSHNVKPPRWGSFADVQYAIRVNSEKIYSCNPDDDVLVMPLFWGFPLLDYSGYNNHGANHGAIYKDGSLDFDGGNDYVDLDGWYTLNDYSSGSVSVWFKPDVIDTGAAQKQPFSARDGNTNTRVYISQLDDDIVFGLGDSATKITDANSLSVGNWFNAVMIWDGTNVNAYINRIYINTNTYTTGAGSGDKLFNIGTDAGASAFFDGKIPEVRIANVARTSDQIAIFYERPWDLYRRVARPIWSIPAAPSIYIPQIIMF